MTDKSIRNTRVMRMRACYACVRTMHVLNVLHCFTFVKVQYAYTCAVCVYPM